MIIKNKINIFLLLLTGFMSFVFFSCATTVSEKDEKEKESVLSWPKRIGGVEYDDGFGITTDSENNVIVVGFVRGDADLNGDGDFNDESESVSGIYTSVIIKYNSEGVIQWIRRLYGTSFVAGHGIAADANNNIIVTGGVVGNADFNGDGDFLDDAEDETGCGGWDVFIIKYNSSGIFQWADRMGGTDSDEGNAVAVDNDGNIIISGMIIGDVDFNHDGDYNDDAESSTNYGYSDVFVSVYNSSGVLQWAKRMGGTAESGGVTDCGLSLAVDTQNNIILTGQVYLNADLNGDGDMLDDYESSLEYVDWDMFISKFNSSGSYQWTKRISNGNNYDIAYGIASDSINNIIITGFVGGDIDFNEDGDFLDEFESGSTGLCFTAMYNSSGTFQWVRKINGTALENEGRYVQVKSNNNIVIIGNVKDNADINCDGDYLDNAESSTGYGSVDVLMAEYNSSGALQTAKRLGGADYDIGRSIAIDSNNSIYATGRIIGTADYNGDGDKSDNNIEKTAGYGLSDIFISKFNNGL